MRITQKELARRLGVSRELVAHALQNRPGVAAATRERVLSLAREVGYRPNRIARQLRGGESGLVGVMIGYDNPQVNFDRLGALDREAYRHGYRLMVGLFHDEADRAAAYFADFADRGVESVVWIDQPATPQQLPTIDASLGRAPQVIALHDPLLGAARRVHVDYADGIAQAVRHLTDRGKRRIALVLAAEGWAGNPMRERLQGYRHTLRDLGLPADADLVWVGNDLKADPAAHAEDIVTKLVEAGRADAILASNDLWGVELLKVLRRRGLDVPGKVAVVGFDNLSIAEHFDPPLTTVDQHHEGFARAVVDILRELASSPPDTKAGPCAVVTPRLIVRSTS
jgi:DNA-binding LacI/PurR family transcriptional regulator